MRSTSPSRQNHHVSSDAPIIKGTSKRTNLRSTIKGVIMAESPNIKSTLKMLLPTTFPTAMSARPDSDDATETASSGALVPNATTVSPIVS